MATIATSQLVVGPTIYNIIITVTIVTKRYAVRTEYNIHHGLRRPSKTVIYTVIEYQLLTAGTSCRVVTGYIYVRKSDKLITIIL